MLQIPYIKTEKNITIHINGKPLMCDKKHYNYEKIITILKSKEKINLKELEDLFSMEITIKKASKKLDIIRGQVIYKGNVIDNVLTKKIISMIKEGFDVQYMINFLDNLLDNPSKTAIDELYQFMEIGEIPISKDGYLYAYKKVREDFKDIYSGKFDNSIGKIVKMNRSEVDDNREKTCSNGLHFCSFDYLKNFGSNAEDNCKIVVVKVNPKDVVSIPIDYNFTKARCCKYVVVKDITKDYFKSLKNKKKILEKSSIFEEE